MTNHTTPVSVGGAFRKKPIVVEAFCLDGGPMPDWFLDARSADVVQTFSQGTGNPFDDPLKFAYIHTLEGVMRAERGDWIIRGIKGEMYPCKPDIFEVTYEPAALPPPPQGEGKPRTPAEWTLAGCRCVLFGKGNPHWPCALHPGGQGEGKQQGGREAFEAAMGKIVELKPDPSGDWTYECTRAEFAWRGWQQALASQGSGGDAKAAFEDRYSRSAEDPSSAEMLEIWLDAWNARGMVLTEDDAFTLIGQAALMREEGKEDMPAFFYDLAARIFETLGNKVGADRARALAASPVPSSTPLPDDDLPEGITEHDGVYFAVCCCCGKDDAISVDLREIPATDYQHYCGGSPRCCP